MSRSPINRLRTFRISNGVDRLLTNSSSKIRSLLDDYLKIFQRSIDKFGIYGPNADEIIKDVDLTNKTCLITGANSGIGLELTRCLTSKNCTVLMGCRNTYAADVAARKVCEKTDYTKIYKLNLASLTSVKKCSNEIINDIPKLDIVILNAAVFGIPWSLTEDSLETTFQVNYLSHYYLLQNLEQILSPDARVVFVSSDSHRYINWSYEMCIAPTKDMLSLPEREYSSIRSYNISKLCNILLMHYLGYRWLNSSKIVCCASPGSFIKTRLCRNWWPFELLYGFMQPFSKNVKQAAATPLYCAILSDKRMSDQYYKNLRQRDESEMAKDLQLAFRIYELTQEILRDRIVVDTEIPCLEQNKIEQYPDSVKDAIDENTLVANYTG